MPVVSVGDAREALAVIARRFYGIPDRNLVNVAITGTNGKTTVSWLLAAAVSQRCNGAVHIGTLGMRVLDAEGQERREFYRDSGTTTPEPIQLHRFLSDVQSADLHAMIAEVSSHALVQKRTYGVEWDAAVFTNLTRDHLDYHETFEAYGEAKKLLFFSELARSPRSPRRAVINIDDPFGKMIADDLCKASGISCTTFSAKRNAQADVFLCHASVSRYETHLELSLGKDRVQLKSALIGGYNVSNLLAAASTLHAFDYPATEVAQRLSKVPTVPGRLELVARTEPAIFVDYAHTPDALVRAQNSLRELATGRLITVFGCGGDRDRGKRPLMGQAVSELSDLALVTSDNPRGEDPEKIIGEILPGLSSARRRSGFQFQAIADRQAAIERAVELARPGDIILVAGKGHESYQESCGVRHPFLDRDVCYRSLERRGLL